MGAARSAFRFAPLGIALLCVQLDFFSLNLALPTIAHGIGVPVTDLQWLVSGYLLSLGALTVPAGRIGDLLGRRPALIAGLVVFALTSLACGLSSSTLPLVVFRVIQGAGAALIMPTAFALIANDTDEKERPRIVGAIIGMAGVGTALGPIVGGLFASTVGWQWVFWINVPFAAIAIVGALRVKNSRNTSLPRSVRNVDWRGVASVVTGLGLLSVGIDAVPSSGWLYPGTLALLAGGLVALVLFVLVERRAAWPLVRPDLFRNGPFVALLVVGTIANVGTNVFILMATLDLQDVRGESPAVAGLLFVSASLGVALAGPVAGWLCSKIAPATVLGIATIVGALSLCGVAFAGNLALYMVALAVAGLCCAMGYSVTQVGVQSVVPPERSGEANSFLLMPVIALGGVSVVVASGIVEGIGAGTPTLAGIRVVLVGTAIVMTLAGVGLLLALGGRRPAQTAPASVSRA